MKYIMTSTTFTGEVMFEYDDNSQLLLNYSVEHAKLSERQQVWLLKHLPRELAEMESITQSNPAIKFTEMKEAEITFELFWNKYDDKINSSRKRTLAAWNKLNVTNRQRAYRFIPTYFANIPQGTRKKYAETYINAELWNN